MSSNIIDLLAIQDRDAVENSYYRSPKVSPNIIKHKNTIEIKTIDNNVFIDKIDETILYIISDFKFAPYWLVQQWFEDFNIKDSFPIISNWISVGLVWAETSSMGVFIRPTKFLLDMFKIEQQKYVEIPFGLLNHTCGEEQLCFDIMMGNLKSEMWNVIKEEETLPCYHPLEIEPEQEDGTIVIREGNFRSSRYKPEELLQKDDDLKREIKSGEKFTSEILEWSLFPIVYVENDGSIITQTPDVIVPLPRKDGLPQSYSIEIELSPKTPEKYKDIMLHYKNNIKFGKLFYLCGSKRIYKLVKEAFQKVGGLGNCRLYLLPFKPPAMRLSNYSIEDEQNQGKLLKSTIENTIIQS